MFRGGREDDTRAVGHQERGKARPEAAFGREGGFAHVHQHSAVPRGNARRCSIQMKSGLNVEITESKSLPSFVYTKSDISQILF